MTEITHSYLPLPTQQQHHHYDIQRFCYTLANFQIQAQKGNIS